MSVLMKFTKKRAFEDSLPPPISLSSPPQEETFQNALKGAIFKALVPHIEQIAHQVSAKT